MDRNAFIKTCGFACVGGFGMMALLQGCASSKQLNGKIIGDDLVVLLSDFEYKKGTQIGFKKYVIVQNETLLFPVCVYRFSQNEYAALWMRCSHQGAELQVFGDRLQCPAHGSEFTSNGLVQNGPADLPLRTFRVSIWKNQLKISLKAV